MDTFIYMPRGGLGFFHERTTPYVLRWTWHNGSMHVRGGVHLSWCACTPGRWWRDRARAIAIQITDATGGVAWDRNGTIHVIVPAHHAHQAWFLIRAAADAAGDPIPFDGWENYKAMAACAMAWGSRLKKLGDDFIPELHYPGRDLPSPLPPKYKDWEPNTNPPRQLLDLCEAKLHLGAADYEQVRWHYASDLLDKFQERGAGQCATINLCGDLAEFLRTGEPSDWLLAMGEKHGAEIARCPAPEDLVI